jgi:hypothetical protein
MPDCTVEVAGHGARVTIEVLGYERPGAQEESDANWLTCHLAVQVGGFSGWLQVAFTTHDFVRFLEELRPVYTHVSGTARFRTDEGQLELDVEMSRLGTARISGVVVNHDGPQAMLTFRFESDQSFLGQTCRELETVVEQFPVIGGPDQY